MNNKHDPVKKVFGKSAKELFADAKRSHADFHSSNAFCGNAGPEEFKHLQWLLDDLTDDEIRVLVKAVGIRFADPLRDIDRDTLEGVLDEADREVFYREYHRLLDSRRSE
jgi:hypothetical protein